MSNLETRENLGGITRENLHYLREEINIVNITFEWFEKKELTQLTSIFDKNFNF